MRNPRAIIFSAARKLNLIQTIGVLALLFAPFLGSCSSLPPLDTPSGKPEVFIEGTTKAQVMEVLVVEVMGWGYSVTEQTDFSILFVKSADDLGTQLMFGSKYNSTPEKRLRCTLAQAGGGVNLVGRFSIVTNPGSGFEKANDLSANSKGAHDIQAVFLRVKARLENSGS